MPTHANTDATIHRKPSPQAPLCRLATAAAASLLLPLLAVLLLGGPPATSLASVGVAAASVDPLDCTLAYRCDGGHETAFTTIFLPSGPYTEDARTDLEDSLAALAAASPQHASYAIAPAASGSSAMGTLRVVVDGCAFDGGLAIVLPLTAPTPSGGGADDRPVISIEIADTNITGGCAIYPYGALTFTAQALPSPPGTPSASSSTTQSSALSVTLPIKI